MSRENSERRATERLAPRVETTTPDYSPFSSGQTYEEINWARLSPMFRDVHNRLRQTKGLPAIPPPPVDLYVAPKAPSVRKFVMSDPEALAAAREFLRPVGVPMLPGSEGFTVNGIKQKL